MNRKGLTAGAVVAIVIGVAVALGWLGGPGRQPAVSPSPTPTPTVSVAVKRTISLAFYNAALDGDASGNIMCSAKGIVRVTREIPVTQTPIQDAIRLLLSSRPTAQEATQGLVSEFPLEGVKLAAASLTGGVLTLTFEDPDHRTGGGSCFVSILQAQIEATAKQFPEVREVRLAPGDLFQP